MASTSTTSHTSTSNNGSPTHHHHDTEETDEAHNVNDDATGPNAIPDAECTFTCFGKLPFELRLMIWEFACWHERALDIWLAKPFGRTIKLVFDNPLDDDDEELDSFKYITTTLPPAVLHACQDSRAAGLKHYDLAFGTRSEIGYTQILAPAHIYANFETDRIFLMGAWGHKDFNKIFYWGANKIAFSTACLAYGVS
jgi:hypothetical protein